MPIEKLTQIIIKCFSPLCTLRDIFWLKWQAFKRNNPVGTDEPFFHSESSEIPAGETKVFKLLIPEPRNKVFFLREVNYNFFDDSEYRLSKDGKVLIVPMVIHDISPGIKFEPPETFTRNVILRIKNNSSEARTYHWFCRGWKRFK